MKNIIKKTKRQIKEWRKINAIYLSGQSLIFKIFKEILQTDMKNSDNPVLKHGESLQYSSL